MFTLVLQDKLPLSWTAKIIWHIDKEMFTLVLQDKLPLMWTAKIIWHNMIGKEVFSLLQDKLPLLWTENIIWHLGKERFTLVLQDPCINKLPLMRTAKIIWHNIMGKEVFSLYYKTNFHWCELPR